MPVINAFLSGSNRTIEQSIEGRRITQPWTVLVSDLTDDEQVAVNAPGLPAEGQMLPGDPSMVCKRKRARSRSQFLYEVDVEFGGRGTAQSPNPTSQQAILRWSTATGTERTNVDLDGKTVMNTAYMPFDGGMEIEVVDQVLSVQRFLDHSEFDSKRFRTYKRAVNSDKFMHAAVGQALIVSLDAEFIKEGIYSYWDVSASVQFKDPEDYPGIDPAKLWYARKINEGFEEFLGMQTISIGPFGSLPVPKWRTILDDNGNRITRPALLKFDENTGTTVRLGIPSQTNPLQILYYRRYKTAPYGSLALFRGLS